MSNKKADPRLAEGVLKILYFGRQRIVITSGEVDMTGDAVSLEKVTTIRSWGTVRGLGQIAAHGPTKETKLDACPHGICIPMQALHEVMYVNPEAAPTWKKALDLAERELLEGKN